MNDTTSTNTTAQIQKLRAALDLIEAHPNLPTPMISAYTSGTVDVDWFVRGDDQREVMNQIRRELGGTWDKDANLSNFRLTTERDGLRMAISADREQVCEAVVVGSETVTVPAVEAKPERTETRDVIEWRCAPVTEQVSA